MLRPINKLLLFARAGLSWWFVSTTAQVQAAVSDAIVQTKSQILQVGPLPASCEWCAVSRRARVSPAPESSSLHVAGSIRAHGGASRGQPGAARRAARRRRVARARESPSPPAGRMSLAQPTCLACWPSAVAAPAVAVPKLCGLHANTF
jgi:hypothetical protein